MIANGFDKAVLGVAYIKPIAENIVIYSADKCIEILVERDEMTYEDARDFFEFNVECAHVGEKTPIFVWGLWEDENETNE